MMDQKSLGWIRSPLGGTKVPWMDKTPHGWVKTPRVDENPIGWVKNPLDG